MRLSICKYHLQATSTLEHVAFRIGGNIYSSGLLLKGAFIAFNIYISKGGEQMICRGVCFSGGN